MARQHQRCSLCSCLGACCWEAEGSADTAACTAAVRTFWGMRRCLGEPLVCCPAGRHALLHGGLALCLVHAAVQSRSCWRVCLHPQAEHQGMQEPSILTVSTFCTAKGDDDSRQDQLCEASAAVT